MSTRESWESLYDERLRLKAENDALKLRVAVLEKAVEEANAAKHAANNRCQAVVGVFETVIKWLKRVAPGDAGMGQLMLETALKTSDSEDREFGRQQAERLAPRPARARKGARR